MSARLVTRPPHAVDAPPIPTTPVKGYTPAQWRDMLAAPLDTRFDTGTYCPMDDTLLRVRLDGWTCRTCRGAWDFRGVSGWWLPLLDAVEVPVASDLVIDGHLVEPREPGLDAEAQRLRRFDRAAPLAAFGGAVIGGGYAAGRAMRSHADVVPEDLLWAVTLMAFGALLIAGALVLAWNWWQGRRQDDADGTGA